MVAYDPTVAGNQLALQRQINRLAIAPHGPASIGPGEGHLRLTNGTHDTGYLDFEGMKVRYRGALQPLTWLTETFATGIEGHTTALAAHAGRLDGHDARITKAQNDVIGVHASVGALNTRMGTAESTLSSHDGRITKAQNDVIGVYNTVVEHDGRITAARSAASTAQSRADSAHSLASGRATQGQISDLSGMISSLAGRMSTVEGRVSTIITFLRSKYSDFPM